MQADFNHTPAKKKHVRISEFDLLRGGESRQPLPWYSSLLHFVFRLEWLHFFSVVFPDFPALSALVRPSLDA